MLSKRCTLLNFALSVGLIWLLLLVYFHTSTLDNLNLNEYDFDSKNPPIAMKVQKSDKNFQKIDKNLEKFDAKFADFQLKSRKKKIKTKKSAFVWPKLSEEILKYHKILNLTDPGHLGSPVNLPSSLPPDIQAKVNKSYEIYKINEFVANLVPLDRDLPDIRPEICRTMTYLEDLPQVSVIMVFHNEPLVMILRSVFAVFKRTSERLLKEIVLIDDASTHGEGI